MIKRSYFISYKKVYSKNGSYHHGYKHFTVCSVFARSDKVLNDILKVIEDETKDIDGNIEILSFNRV